MGLQPREHPFDAGFQGLLGSCRMVRELLRPGVPLIDDVGNVPNAGAEENAAAASAMVGAAGTLFAFTFLGCSFRTPKICILMYLLVYTYFAYAYC